MLKIHRWFILVGVIFIVFIFLSIDFKTEKSNSGFNKWVKEFSKDLESFGVSKRVIENFKKEVKPNTILIEKNKLIKERTLSVDRKINLILNDDLTLAAQLFFKENQATLNENQKKYNAPSSVVVSIIGVGSAFGVNIGNTPAMDNLATLAYMNNKNTQYPKELIALLQLVTNNHIPLNALGHEDGTISQLGIYPSVYYNRGVDEDNNGQIDLFNSKADIIATGYNIISGVSWDKNNKWGDKVVIPSNVELSNQQGIKNAKPLEDWKALGLIKEDGEMLPMTTSTSTLILMDRTTSGILLYPNFNAIFSLNRDLSKSIAVGILSDQISSYSTLVNYAKTNVKSQPKPVIKKNTKVKKDELLKNKKYRDSIK